MAKTPKSKIPVPTDDKEPPQYLMMLGTSKNLDYLVLARKGDVVMGLKPNMVTSGPADTTYIGARVRSATAKGVFPDEDNVHSISAAKQDFASPWPEFSFENSNHERASGQICIYLRGDIRKDPEAIWPQVEDGKIGKSMAKFLIEKIGAEHMVISEELLIQFINEQYDKAFTSLKQFIERRKAEEEAVNEGIGVFGMQADLLKKIHKAKFGVNHDEVPDLDVGPDDEEDGEGEED